MHSSNDLVREEFEPCVGGGGAGGWEWIISSEIEVNKALLAANHSDSDT